MYCAKPDDQKYKNHFKAGLFFCNLYNIFTVRVTAQKQQY